MGLHLGEEWHASSGLSHLGVAAALGLHVQRFWFPRKGVAVQLSTSFVACVATFTDATWTETLLVQEHCNERQTKNSNIFRRGPSSTFYTYSMATCFFTTNLLNMCILCRSNQSQLPWIRGPFPRSRRNMGVLWKTSYAPSYTKLPQ